MKYFIYLFLSLLLGLDLYASTLDKKQVINIGVLSFRPISENQKIWLPLREELHKYAPQFDFNITSYPQNQLVKKIAQGKFDFAVVHPGAYVELETEYGVSNIASLVRQTKDGKYHLKNYGGVIAVLSSNKDIHSLKDVIGKTIATTHKEGFAVMLVQRELFHNAGVDITKECNILYTGQPMDKVVESLREHKADVGFFRTGYIEELIARGKIKPGELRIIHKIVNDNYPYAHSTPLYPEWAVLATSKPKAKTVKAVTAALYQIHSGTSLAYHEFSMPLSYKSTRELMQKYHVFPFEQTRMSIKEVIQTYFYEIIGLLLFLAFGGVVMAVIYRYQMLHIEKQSEQIKLILSNASDGIHVHDPDGNLLMFSDSFANMLGYTREELSKLSLYDWDHYFDHNEIKTMIKKVMDAPRIFETKHTRKDGTIFDVEIFSKGIVIDDQNYIYASARDISERKNNEIRLLQHKIIFDNIAEGVYAVDRFNMCTFINDVALDLLGLKEEDILGKNPHNVFHSKYSDGNVYENEKCPVQTAVISGIPKNIEEEFVRKDGSLLPVFITVAPIIKDDVFIGSVVTFADISKQKADQKKLMMEREKFGYLAHHDSLTNLPNRLSLIEHLESQCSRQNRFAFMFFDMDGFKEINDSYGHQFGDKLLIEIAGVLKKVFPPEAFIVRTGGDEFVVVIECQNDDDIINIYMNDLIDILNHSFKIDAIEVYITASVGIAIYPDDAKTTKELMQNADAAMYNAKKMGKNTFSFYNVSLTQNALHKTTVATNLKKALFNRDLMLFFQPQIDPYSQKIIGVEALLRWFLEDEAVSPAIFIPIAEEMGLILEIGEFVLKESFTAAKELSDKKLLSGRLSVNVSVRQLVHPNFLSSLEEILKETRCDPSSIELEITESSILENPSGMVVLLNKLKKIGFHISIDDFGTGYSSMAYLKNLPIDKLKIDQSFIRDIKKEPKNQTIVKTMIALAKGLDMKVLAEGVETQEELEFLKDNGIDSIQGYYYHKPMPLGDFEKALQ
ncbi:EAL domain-containing protein [Sulfurimonas sp. HSL-1716]|uniref:EAL domain-containing protein n=1 Tax=Hydrocurvibacter sulfurireducens TaxID=3131937 RepID=UPI0031FA0F83